MTKCSPEFLSLVDECLQPFAKIDDDDLSSVLSSEDLTALQAHYPNSRSRDFLPVKTLTLFMRQVASDTKSCRHALIGEASDQAAMDRKPSNTHTSAYCMARERLTESSINALMCQSGVKLDKASPDSWLWHQRRVLLTEGSTLLMPDTAENQKVYPQLKSQKKSQKKDADFPY